MAGEAKGHAAMKVLSRLQRDDAEKFGMQTKQWLSEMEREKTRSLLWPQHVPLTTQTTKLRDPKVTGRLDWNVYEPYYCDDVAI
jgi:hypothetical protein